MPSHLRVICGHFCPATEELSEYPGPLKLKIFTIWLALAQVCQAIPGLEDQKKKTKLHHMISGLFPQVPGCLRVWWPLLTASFFALVCKTGPLTTSAGFLNRKFP